MAAHDSIARPKGRFRSLTLHNILSDLVLIQRGVLDWRSFLNGYRKVDDPAEVVVRRADGSVKQISRSRNLRTNAGGDAQANVMGQASGNPAIYMALTLDSNRPQVTDIVLPGELTQFGLGRQAAAFSHAAVAGTGPNTIVGSYSLTGTWTYSGISTQAIAKIGVYDAPAGGTLWFEFRLPTIMTVAPGDQIAITHSVNY